MIPAAPRLQLDTLFVLSERGRILSTRQPLPSPDPAFMLIHGATEVAWAVRDNLADEPADLARHGDVATRFASLIACGNRPASGQ
jgi:hypothetical protein